MGDPFGFRDDACWKCIVRELRKSGHTGAAEDLQAALDNPFPETALRVFDAKPQHRLDVDAAERTCRFRGECR